MFARIMKIKNGTVVLKTEHEDYLEVSEKEIDFPHGLGDVIEVDAGGDAYYFLPVQKDDLYNFEQTTKPTTKRAGIKNSHLKGVGGWLVFYIVITVLAILVEIYRLTHSSLDVGDCSTLNKIGKGLCNELGPILAIENVVTIIGIVFQVALITLIAQRKRSSVNFAIGLSIAIFVWDIIDAIMAYTVIDKYFPSSAMGPIYRQMAIQIARGAIFLLWIPYFRNSERVKQTLIEK